MVDHDEFNPENINVGDAVWLINDRDHPPMTVTAIGPFPPILTVRERNHPFAPFAVCDWRDNGNKPQRESYPLTALTKTGPQA